MGVKKLIGSRRGIAIELAIGAMFLTVALSIILITVATHQTALMRSAREELAEKIMLTEVGDAAVAGYSSLSTDKNNPTPLGGGYSAAKVNNIITVVKEGTTVLTIEVDADGKISSWK